MKRWNQCDTCGRFISMDDFARGAAVRWMEAPDSEFTVETYTTRCADHHPIMEPEDRCPRTVLR